MKKLIFTIIGVMACINVCFAVTCDATKTVDGKEICVVNVPLDIPQSVIDGFGIEFYAQKHGWNPQVPDPNCTPSPAVTCPSCTPQSAVTCTPEEIATGCEPRDEITCPECTPADAVVCSMVNNPETALEFSKRIIRGKVKEEYIEKYRQHVATQYAIQAEAQAKALFPEE